MIKTLTGDPQLTGEVLKQILSEHTARHGELTVERYDGIDISFNDLVSTLSNVSLFEESKIVIVQGLLKNAELAGRVEELVQTTPEDQVFVVREQEVDKRSAGFKKLKELTVFMDLANPKGVDLAKILQKYTKDVLGVDITTGEINYIVNTAGEDLGMLKTELAKLAAHGDFSRDSVDLLVEKQLSSKVFDLLEAAMNKNSVRALELYKEQRQQRVEPQAILGMLVWQLQLLVLAKTSSNIDATAKSSGVSAYPLKKAQALTRSMSFSFIEGLVRKTAATDIAVKQGANADEAVQLLILEFSR